MISRIRSLAVAVLVLAGVLFVGVPVAEACGSPPPPQPPITIKLHEVCFDLKAPHKCMIRAWIIIHGYTTFGSTQPTFCACSLRKVPKIKKVLYARFIDPRTGQRFPAFSFDADAAVGPNFAAVSSNGGTFDGFLSPVQVDIAPGTSLDLHFEVLLEGGTEASEVANSVQVANLAGTAQADAAGNLIDHILFVDNSGTSSCTTSDEWTVFLNGAELNEAESTGDDTFVDQVEACPQPVEEEPVATGRP